MSKLIDLSHKIDNDTPVHNFDNKIRLFLDRNLAEHKYNNSRIEIGMHAGTHIDIPSHLLDNNISIDEIDITSFIGSGKLINVRGKDVIKKSHVDDNILSENDIAIFFTGHSDNYYNDKYYNDHPVFDSDLIDYLIDLRIKILGMDLPSPDRFPFELHKRLLKNDILILENLTNLDKLLTINSFEIIAFPLKIRAEGSLVRAVARIIEV